MSGRGKNCNKMMTRGVSPHLISKMDYTNYQLRHKKKTMTGMEWMTMKHLFPTKLPAITLLSVIACSHYIIGLNDDDIAQLIR
jgi:hypothetical protein